MDEPRPVNPALMLGLIALPILFVWVLFLPGYARSTRIAALSYALGPSVFVATGVLLHAGSAAVFG